MRSTVLLLPLLTLTTAARADIDCPDPREIATATVVETTYDGEVGDDLGFTFALGATEDGGVTLEVRDADGYVGELYFQEVAQ